MSGPRGQSDENKAYRSFIVSISLTILLCFGGIFLGMAIRNDALIRETLLARARSLFQEIVLTRSWNAAYGGVYVLKAPGVDSNPWLIDPDIKAADGRVLTKRNPALMTREISEIASREADFAFRITSLRPLNPANAADAFETEALTLFETGKTETWRTVKESGVVRFRYMGVLRTEKSCLQCHAIQGYVEGQVRGGISVSFGIEHIVRVQTANGISVAAAGTALSAGILWLIFSFSASLRKKLDTARHDLLEAAIRDGLTGIYNRRHIMERFGEEFAQAKRTKAAFACAMIDVDNFKRVNDELGHMTGDIVLKSLAAIMGDETRPYDSIGRFGGEEFLILLPATGHNEAVATCERIRKAVWERLPPTTGYPSRPFSISIGISCWEETDPDSDAMLARADSALYRAKAAGKNRCEG